MDSSPKRDFRGALDRAPPYCPPNPQPIWKERKGWGPLISKGPKATRSCPLWVPGSPRPATAVWIVLSAPWDQRWEKAAQGKGC